MNAGELPRSRVKQVHSMEEVVEVPVAQPIKEAADVPQGQAVRPVATPEPPDAARARTSAPTPTPTPTQTPSSNQAVQPTQTPTQAPSTNHSVPALATSPRVFFLFLTVAGIERPDLWDAFFSGVQPSSYRNLMHCKEKHACDQKLAVSNKIGLTVVPSVPTFYCRDLVSAMWQLLRVAYSESTHEGDRFVFVSESTLPVKPFTHVYSTLVFGASAFCIYTKEHWVQLNLSGGRSALIVKHSQWVALDRDRARTLVNGWPTLKAQLTEHHWAVPVWLDAERRWDKISSSGVVPLPMCVDEWAIFAAIYGAILYDGRDQINHLPGFEPESLHLRGFKPKYTTQGTCHTFAFWDVDDELETQELVRAVAPGLSCYPQCHGSHPAEFVTVSDTAATALARSEFLFARKFRGSAMSLEQYKRIILGVSPDFAR